jgi:pimeloyl-ACP methyl ester carboxylesterase
MAPPQIPRYRPGTDLLGFEKPPADILPELVRLKAEDGAPSRGMLYAKGGETTVVCVLHPRGDMTRHYLIPFIAEAGFAVFGQESRSPNNDTMATHEALLADIAAAVRYLRERGYGKVIFLGYSGGGSVYSLYQAQALSAPPGRLTDTAAGDSYDLNRFDLPPADGMMFVGSHLGAGWMMQREIDPSVMDEADPLSCDPSLDMYNPDNGFREPPEQSHYSEAFIARYRAAQVARVTRIDAIARSELAEQRRFQAMNRAEAFNDLPPAERIFISRRAVSGRFLQIFRTDANPSTLDLSIEPSDRSLGSINSLRPDLTNYMDNGFARILTPRAWLSLWSGLSSRAVVLENLPKVVVPTLIVGFTGDNAILPSAGRAMFERSPAADKTLHYVKADHFGFHLPAHPNSGGRQEAGTIVATWLRERFPSRPSGGSAR